MTISQPLVLAILAMDAYNREYNAGIVVPGTSLGFADFKDHAVRGVTGTQYSAWQSSGFYASSYDVSGGALSGKTIISYRGTSTETLGATGLDVLNGWVNCNAPYPSVTAMLRSSSLISAA